jgi:hypothetical protein
VLLRIIKKNEARRLELFMNESEPNLPVALLLKQTPSHVRLVLRVFQPPPANSSTKPTAAGGRSAIAFVHVAAGSLYWLASDSAWPDVHTRSAPRQHPAADKNMQ